MRVRLMLAAVVIGAAVTAGSVRMAAITYGFIDTSDSFPNVGAVIFRSPDSGQIVPFCSGTLIAPDVFLTASHCTAFFEQVLAPDGFTLHISFDNPIPFGSLTSGGTVLIDVVQIVTNPAFTQAQNDSGDIAVLLLDPLDTQGITPAALPAAGFLEAFFLGHPVTNVGYGVQQRVVGGGVPFFSDMNPIPRMFSFSTFRALNVGYVRYSQNPATGDGGTCFADSGGPQFASHDGTTVLASITITGDAVCRAANVGYRLDTASARSFLGNFVALP